MAFNPKNIELEEAAKNNRGTNTHTATKYEAPPLFKFFRNLLVLGIAVAVVAVAYTGYWFFAATSLKDAVTNWMSDQAAQGITATFSQIEISGFPLKFNVVLANPKLQSAVLISNTQRQFGQESWAWQGDKVIAEMRPWNFNRLQLDLSGNHQFNYDHPAGSYDFSGGVKKLHIDAENLSETWPKKIQIEIEEFKAVDVGSGIPIGIANASILSQRLRSSGQKINSDAKTATYFLKSEMTDLLLPSFLNLALGHMVKQVKSEITVIGDLEPSFSIQNLTKWRDDGGTIEIGLLEGIYGALDTHATGTVALDKNLQPLVAASARFRGFFSAIDALKDAGFVRTGDAAMAKVMLGVFSKRDSQGRRNISLPLSIQDGRLSAGPVPLMELPAIDWGEELPSGEGLGRLGQ